MTEHQLNNTGYFLVREYFPWGASKQYAKRIPANNVLGYDYDYKDCVWFWGGGPYSNKEMLNQLKTNWVPPTLELELWQANKLDSFFKEVF